MKYLTFACKAFVISLVFVIALAQYQVALADTTYTLSGQVADQSGNPLPDTMVEVIDPATGTTIDSISTDPNGMYSLSVNEGTYNVRVTPPAGSGFVPITAVNQNINDDKTINFVLVPVGLVSLSGHVLDLLGNPLSDVEMYLSAGPGGWITSTRTDAEGNYSFAAAPGNYYIWLQSENDGNLALAVSGKYELASTSPLLLMQSVVMDIQIPTKPVYVHVQDPAGNPVTDVAVRTSEACDSNLMIGILPARGCTSYNGNQFRTDVLGDLKLWLFAAGQTMDFTASPPVGSVFAETVINGVTILPDVIVTMTLSTQVTLSGHVLDLLGNPLSDVEMYLSAGPGGWITSTRTDAEGNYSFAAAPGNYYIWLQSENDGNLALAVSGKYELASTSPLLLMQSVVMDIQIPTKPVYVHVQDPAGNPVTDVAVRTSEACDSNLMIGILPARGCTSYNGNQFRTDVLGDLKLWLFAAGQTMDFTASPPVGSVFAETVINGVTILPDVIVTMTLSTQVTLSGHVLDLLGNPLSDVEMYLSAGPGGWITSTRTDAEGNYSFAAAPGNYYIWLQSENDGNLALAVSGKYELASTSPLSLMQSVVMDIQIPTKPVYVHVQDPAGNPVTDVAVRTSEACDSNLMIGILPARGCTSYNGNQFRTDVLGDLKLWLFAAGQTMDFTASPPVGSVFAETVINGVTILPDVTEIIVLQFEHAPPETIATLRSLPNTNDEYPDPANVSLSATAAEGYIIAATYYRVDVGEQQTYTEPFTISGGGSHTIEYWSVDNFGIFELPKALDFNIVTNQPPNANAGETYIVDEGDTLTLDASNSSDPDENIVLYEWDLDNDGEYDDATGVTTDVSFADDGIYIVGLKVMDDYGEFDTAMAEITVTNVSPSVYVGQGASLNEGNTFVGNGSFTDPGADTWIATIDYGDGAGVETLNLNADKTFELNHPYLDNGEYAAEICVSDDDDGVGCDTVTVSVTNVAPTIETLIVPLDPIQVGITVETSATFTDPGVLDTHSAIWDWGDSSTSEGVIDDYNISSSHIYETPGVYTITLTVEDGDGGADTATFQYVVIYDPEGGFVTGGGWIWSPLGAYVPDDTLEGKATFGFVSKYKKGATLPTGNTEFQFHVADLNFKSTSYDWLVIAGSKAKYKGTGTINGMGEYGFMLSAIDSTPDMFRIKIWDKATEMVIYDNQLEAAEDADPVTALGGGSIVVHKEK